jgi:hypothetical protein
MDKLVIQAKLTADEAYARFTGAARRKDKPRKVEILTPTRRATDIIERCLRVRWFNLTPMFCFLSSVSCILSVGLSVVKFRFNLGSLSDELHFICHWLCVIELLVC